jgi:ferrous iron transport protein A
MDAHTARLSDWPDHAPAVVQAVHDAPAAGSGIAARLAQLGFIAGEPVRILRRGPGGREPLAVQIGETLFALRWAEAHCIEVAPPAHD